MASIIGGGMRGCLLAGCVLAAVSAGTITQQSSSAWGSVADGVTLERGSHTSHTSNPLRDEPQLDLRGGFGSSRRQPQPSAGAEHIASQQPLPEAGLEGFHTTYNNFMPQYPGSGLPGGFQQPLPNFPQPQPVPSLHGGFVSGRQPYAGASYDASRHRQPAGIRPVSGPLPGQATPAAVPVTPVLGTPSLGGAGPAGGAGGAAVPALGLQPGQPLFQPPDLHSIVTQMTSQVFQNLANSLPQPQRTGDSAIYPPTVQTYRK